MIQFLIVMLSIELHLLQILLSVLLECDGESTVEKIRDFLDWILPQGAKNALSKSILNVLVANMLLILAQKDSNLAHAHV